MKAEQQDRASTLQRWVPGLRLAHSYRASWLRFDLVAGVVLAAILVPQGMAYAELAGLPPVTGLYTTIACLVGYAILGPSRVLVLGPDSSISPLIFAAITPLLVAGDDAGQAIALAGMLAVFVGLIEIALGLGKLGFVADLLSKEVQVGYMNGLGITIIVGQLPKLFGFSTDADGFVDEVREFFTNLDQTQPPRSCSARQSSRSSSSCPGSPPRSRLCSWRSSAPPQSRAALDLAAEGVKVTGALPQGVPAPEVPWTSRVRRGTAAPRRDRHHARLAHRHDRDGDKLRGARGDEVDADQEMVGMGASNIAAGFFQGFAISTSGSRTAVAEQAGAKSQVTGLIGAGVVALLLLVFNSLLADLPQTALAAVVIAAATSLMDVSVLRRYAQVRRSALVLSVVATVGVVLFGVLEGIVVAIVLSILMFFRRNWWPHGAVLGRVDALDGWYSVDRHADSTEVPGVVVYRWEAPLFFANAGVFRDQVRELVRDRNPALRGAAVRGHHRHRRHRGRHARATRRRAERPRRAPRLRRVEEPAP